MALYKPTELRQFLAEQGIVPRKSMSQNFLIDGNIVKKIIKVAEIAEKDLVLEIGPGPGGLTELLLAAGARVIAIEKDYNLAAALQRLQATAKTLHVITGNALEIDLKRILSPYLTEPGFKAKVVANLPYNITTPLLTHLLPRSDLFSQITVMVQEEVAQRIAAKPHTSAMSSLTIFCQFFSEIHYNFKVQRNCFFPAPTVDSAVVTFALNPAPLPEEKREKFFLLTRTAYQHRRKMLRASLRKLAPADAIETALASLALPPTARPEELSLEQFLQLFSLLS